MGSQRVGQDWVTNTFTWLGNNQLVYFRDGMAKWNFKEMQLSKQHLGKAKKKRECSRASPLQ